VAVGNAPGRGDSTRPGPSPLADEVSDRVREHDGLMLSRFLLNWAIVAVAVGVGAAIVPGIEVKGGFFTLLWVALLFGLVNAILGPILHFISLPLTILTFGLFALVVNGVVLMATAGLSDNLDVGGFLGAILGALIISVVIMVLQFVLTPRGQHA